MRWKAAPRRWITRCGTPEYARFSILACLACFSSAAAIPPSTPKIAEDYVAEAMRRNIALQTQMLDVEQGRAKLAEARSAYEPRVDFVARYSMADGGRTIDIPT